MRAYYGLDFPFSKLSKAKKLAAQYLSNTLYPAKKIYKNEKNNNIPTPDPILIVESEQEVSREEMLHILNTNVAGVAKTTQLLGVLRPGGVVVNIRK